MSRFEKFEEDAFTDEELEAMEWDADDGLNGNQVCITCNVFYGLKDIFVGLINLITRK